MRRRRRLNVTVQKYAPKLYSILKSAHDLELPHDVRPTYDVSIASYDMDIPQMTIRLKGLILFINQ